MKQDQDEPEPIPLDQSGHEATPAEKEGMRKFNVLKKLVDKYEPRYGTRMVLDENKSMHEMLREEGEKPADDWHGVPDEKKTRGAKGLSETLAKRAKTNASG